MLNKQDEEIDGLQCSTVQFPAVYAFRLLARLAKSVGPVMGVFSGASPDTELSSLAPQLARALECLDPDEAERLMLELLKQTYVWHGEPSRKVELSDQSKINEVFTGRIMTLFKVMGFALKANFSDFARGIGQLATAVP